MFDSGQTTLGYLPVLLLLRFVLKKETMFIVNFRESYVFHCLVIKVLCCRLADDLFTLSHRRSLVNNFVRFFQNFSNCLICLVRRNNSS